MSHIKEPVGIDFVVDATPITIQERKGISEIIAFYKATGRKISLPTPTVRHRSVGRKVQVVS